MLPNKMKISEKAFLSLRRFQTNTGITVNIGARIAFFTSIETNYQYKNQSSELKCRELDKHTWLGEQSNVVEMLLVQKYPDLQPSSQYQAWASHVEHGASIIESKNNLSAVLNML